MISVTFVLIDHVMKKDQQCKSGFKVKWIKSKMDKGTLCNSEIHILGFDDYCMIKGEDS